MIFTMEKLIRPPNPDDHVADSKKAMATVAMVALVALIADSLLYPDTVSKSAWHLGMIRVSPLGVIFVITAPLIIWYFLRNIRDLTLGVLDVVLIVTIAYMTGRGLLAAQTVDGLGLVLAWSGYILVIYYGAATLFQDLKRRKIIFISLAVLVAISAIYALIEFAAARNIIYGSIISSVPFPGQGYHRSGSFMGSPLAFGLFIVQATPFVLFFLAAVKSWKWRLLLGGVTIIAVLALETTFGKGPWITAGIIGVSASAWLLWKRPSSRKLVGVLLAAVIISVVLFSAIFHSTVTAGTVSKARTSESFKPRLYMWERVPQVLADNLLFGVGMWRGGPAVSDIDVTVTGKYQPTVIDNFYLLVLVEEGALGFMLLGSTFFLISRDIWHLYSSHSRFFKWLVPPVICMAATLINGFSMDTMWLWPTMVVFWLSAGLSRALVEMDRHERLLSSIDDK
ncbi:MAG: O-antigen ligase family protein [Thermoleophilia bacterium]